MTFAIAGNLRKAAVLVRSLDAQTAATLLAQLSAEEAAAIRTAMRSVGSFEPDEQNDIAAELRRARPLAAEDGSKGVELELSSLAGMADTGRTPVAAISSKRFEFLDAAPTETLALYLAREHAQTIAVVVSYLTPARAAGVLAALPAKLQAETMERLAALGDTDPESLSVVERELSAWVARQPIGRRQAARSNQAIQNILAATDAVTRERMLANLMQHNERLASRLAPSWGAPRRKTDEPSAHRDLKEGNHCASSPLRVQHRDDAESPRQRRIDLARPAAHAPTLGQFEFNDLTRLDASELAAVLGDVDATVLVLALAGSSDELENRVAEQMPRRIAKAFRRTLRQLGPTRLSDVEAAQRVVADAAARRLELRRGGFRAASTLSTTNSGL
jgi:flagellar motor switch protein FliG